MRHLALLAALCLFAPAFPLSAAARTPNGTISAVAASQCADAAAFVTPALGASTTGLSIGGTFVATLQFRGTVNGSTFFNLDAYQLPHTSSGSGAVSSTTTTGAWFVPTAGINQVCVYASAYTSGSATVTLEQTFASQTVSPSACAGSAAFSNAFAGAGNKQIVALLAGAKVRICAMYMVASAAASVKFTEGTGADCATGTADVTGAIPLGVNGQIVIGIGGQSVAFSNVAGNALCVNSSAVATISGWLSYAQQ